jgi:hypothetical protein
MCSFGSRAAYYDGHAALYADPKIRPLYPPELFEIIYSFAGSCTGNALDVATGNGQCAHRLATRFQQVFP